MIGLEIWVPVITAIVTGSVTYFAAKANAKKDLQITDRVQLSKDEQQFRSELREELRQNKAEIALLRKEVSQLREINLKLELENRQLHVKVDDLRTELKNFRQEDKESRRHGEWD